MLHLLVEQLQQIAGAESEDFRYREQEVPEVGEGVDWAALHEVACRKLGRMGCVGFCPCCRHPNPDKSGGTDPEAGPPLTANPMLEMGTPRGQGQQMISREGLLDILHRTNWVPDEMPVTHVHLEGTDRGGSDSDSDWEDDGRNDVGTASTPAVPRKGQKGRKGKGQKRGRSISEGHVRFEGPQGGDGGASGGAVV
ncbi:hypothetical protein B484DRAFT_416242 [Ochromonadaceae sp. CCMP2298]|nr:hypothetical protein B484DRAFT_416242 [Ochromonadaceae sp. CCMP2298]